MHVHSQALIPNTFGVQAYARYLVSLQQLEQLPALLQDARWQTLPKLWLGGGSNVLLTQDYPGLVVQVALRGRELLREDAHSRLIAVAAGENWHELVQWSLDQGWGGLENLALIPGTVGAAPIQNIGAYGIELAERLAWVDAWDTLIQQSCCFTVNECNLSYRHSRFKDEPGRYLITRVVLRLPKAPDLRLEYGDIKTELANADITQPTPQQVAAAVVAIRQRKLPDPAQLGNAGSFFQNPIVPATHAAALRQLHPKLPIYPAGDGYCKLAAGWLIEQAGWKGQRLGAAGVYERQALVLVNHGGASGAQLWELAQAIQAAVYQRFAVQLHPEPLIL